MTRVGREGRLEPARAWALLGLVILTRAYRAALLTLVAVAIVPATWSWTANVVRTGSMEPAIRVGDVVVAAPLPRDAGVPIGRVMVFTSPATGRTTVHRVVASAGRARYTTAGDANRGVDPMPVPRSAFHAQGRLRVPFVGLPLVWFWEHDWLRLIGWSLLTALAFGLAPGRWRQVLPPRRRVRTRTRSVSRRPTNLLRHRAGVTHRVAGATALSLGMLVTIQTFPVHAATAFSTTTRNGGDSWTTAAVFVPAYTAQVLADSPSAYYLLDEASGTAATDSSGNSRTGTYTSIAAYHQPGGLPDNAGYSVWLNGSGARIASGGSAISNPTTFTIELWFKTSTTTGGKLFGFGSTRNASSPTYDRFTYMDAGGHLVYGGWANPRPVTITTPRSYNDGAWHHLVLTAVPQGSQQTSTLYVDGTAVVSGVTTKTRAYAGWWQFGYGDLPTGPGYPPSANIVGNLDNIAIYPTALSAARIAAHYQSR